MRVRYVLVVDGVELYESVFNTSDPATDPENMVMQEALKALAHLVVRKGIAQDQATLKKYEDGIEQPTWDRKSWENALNIMYLRKSEGVL